MKTKTAMQFALLCGVPFVMVLGNSMLIPVFPQMEQAMNISPFQVGLVITFFSLPAGFLIPFAGFLSDQYSRKVILVPALFVYGIGGLISGTAALLLSDPYVLLLVGRVVQGIGAGGTYQLAMALTGDVFQTNERTKALGLLEAANGLGKVVSPVLGAAAALAVWYAPFFAYSFIAFPLALGILFVVQEPQRSKEKRSLKQYASCLQQAVRKQVPTLAGCFFTGMVVLFVLFGVLSWFSDILESRYQVFGILKGFILAAPVLAMATSSYISGAFLAPRMKSSPVVCLIALGLGTASLLMMPLFSHGVIVVLLLSLLGAAIGTSLPPINTVITGSVESSQRGIITCLYGSVRFGGVAFGPPLFGLALGIGTWPMLTGAAIVIAAAALSAYFSLTAATRAE